MTNTKYLNSRYNGEFIMINNKFLTFSPVLLLVFYRKPVDAVKWGACELEKQADALPCLWKARWLAGFLWQSSLLGATIPLVAANRLLLFFWRHPICIPEPQRHSIPSVLLLVNREYCFTLTPSRDSWIKNQWEKSYAWMVLVLTNILYEDVL